MKIFVFFICLIPIALLGQGIFTPVTYDQASVGDIDLAEYIGNGKAAIISDGETYELNFDSDYNFSIRYIENTGLDQDKLTKYDVNRDGVDDLLTLSNSGGNIYNYLSTPERFDYVPPLRTGRAFNAQDFDDDGVADLIIDGYVYHHKPDGSLEQIFRRTPSNDYLFKNQQVMDVDQDGDLDILVNLGQNIGYLKRGDTDVLSFQLISQFNESVTWMRVLESNEGPIIVYYSATAQKIRRIIPDNGTYTTIDLVTDQPNFGFDTQVADLDGDGNQELIMTFSQLGRVYVMSYDPISGDVIYKLNELADDQQFMLVDDMEERNFVGVTSTSLRVYSVDSEMNITLDKTSVGNMNLGAKGFVDINGDGYTDMVNSPYQRRYFGNGNFGSIMPFSVPEPGGSYVDYDEDGDADYVLKEVRYENLGDGTFGPSMPNPDFMTYPDPDIFFTNVIYEGDMDMDGDIDLLSYNIFGEPLLVHENIDNEYFLDGIELADNDVLSGNLKGIRLLDLDGDTDEDILMIVASGMVWFRNNGGLQFEAGIILYEGSFRPTSFDIDDANSDGFPDVLLDLGQIVAGSLEGQTLLFSGSTSGLTLARTVSNSDNYRVSSFIDYDEIGVKDIIQSNDNFLQIIRLTDFDDTFPLTKLVTGDFDDFGNYLVDDVDSDGDEDIITYGGTALKYYLKDEDDIDGLCPYEDVIILNNDQLEKYRDRFGFCTELPQSLFVGGTSGWSDIGNLSALNSITKIKGNVTLKYLLGSIGNFSELSNLDSIGGSLRLDIVKPNGLQGFRNIKTIGGSLIINNMISGIQNLDDFINLEHIGGGIGISFTDLQNIDRIFVSNKVGGDVSLSNLSALEDVSFFEQIDTISGNLEIKECTIYDLGSLRNLDYFTGLNIRVPSCTKIELNPKVDSLAGDFAVSISNVGSFVQTNQLKYIGGDFSLYSQNGGDWNDLESTGGGLFGGFENAAPTAFNNLRSIGESFGIRISENDDYSNFQNLEKVGNSFFISGFVKSLDGLQSLDSIGNNFQSSGSDNLVDISHLADDLFVGETWALVNNQNLNVCDIPALCNHIEAGREVDIRQNASLCDDISDIKCIGTSVTGFAYFDFNQDGIRDEATEAPLSNVSFHFNGDTDSLITSSNGFYQRFLLEGQAFDVSALPLDSWEFTTDNSFSIDSFIPGQSIDMFDVGFYPIEESTGFSSSLTTSLFLCDRPFDFNASLSNTGTDISTGYLKIIYSEELELSSDFTTFTSHNTDTRTIIIDFENWYPFFSELYKIPFIAPSADELDNEVILITIQMIDVDENNVETIVHEDYMNLVLLCAYDPNDKLVSSTDKSGNIRIMEQDDELIYTIRFQNTGNFYAEDVRITDVVSEELDLSTFTYLSSSHDVDITMREREVTFMFEDIFLIDSTANFLESQGYVSFSIKPYVIVLNDEFENQANIYFDFNDPIITNIAESKVYDPSVAVSEVLTKDEILVYPQPCIDILTIDVSESVNGPWTYSIVDVSGRVVLDQQIFTQSRVVLDVSEYHSGLYLLTINSEDVSITQMISVLK